MQAVFSPIDAFSTSALTSCYILRTTSHARMHVPSFVFPARATNGLRPVLRAPCCERRPPTPPRYHGDVSNGRHAHHGDEPAGLTPSAPPPRASLFRPRRQLAVALLSARPGAAAATAVASPGSGARHASDATAALLPRPCRCSARLAARLRCPTLRPARLCRRSSAPRSAPGRCSRCSWTRWAASS